MLSFTEENYIKALYHLTFSDPDKKETGTTEIAGTLDVKPATANHMIKKLSDKKLIRYEKYGKIQLTPEGKKKALHILRKHRLWETFLYEKLEFDWDEVHEVAEQLEHIYSAKLVDRLDKFLGYPKVDPHGDPIPDAKGKMKPVFRNSLSEIEPGKSCKMVAVKDDSAAFLQYVVKIGLSLNTNIKVIARQEFDSTVEIEINKVKKRVSQKFADHILVVPL